MRSLQYAENGLCQKIPEKIEGIVFLDVDGVLNRLNGNDHSVIKVKYEILKRINQFLEKNNLYIVFVTDHAYERGNGVFDEYDDFVLQNIFNIDRILGRVPRGEKKRGVNIQSFRDQIKEIKDIPFVIFDDNPIGGNMETQKHHIQTDPKKGLSEENLREAIKKLKN